MQAEEALWEMTWRHRISMIETRGNLGCEKFLSQG